MVIKYLVIYRKNNVDKVVYIADSPEEAEHEQEKLRRKSFENREEPFLYYITRDFITEPKDLIEKFTKEYKQMTNEMNKNHIHMSEHDIGFDKGYVSALIYVVNELKKLQSEV